MEKCLVQASLYKLSRQGGVIFNWKCDNRISTVNLLTYIWLAIALLFNIKGSMQVSAVAFFFFHQSSQTEKCLQRPGVCTTFIKFQVGDFCMFACWGYADRLQQICQNAMDMCGAPFSEGLARFFVFSWRINQLAYFAWVQWLLSLANLRETLAQSSRETRLPWIRGCQRRRVIAAVWEPSSGGEETRACD